MTKHQATILNSLTFALTFIFTLTSCQAGFSTPTSTSTMPLDLPTQPENTPSQPDPFDATPTVTSGADYAFSGQTVQLAWFYNPPINYDLSTLAAKFDVFILTKNYNGEREALRFMGVKAPIIKYLAFFEIQDLPCDEQPWQNNAAFKIGDFCSIKNNHPDWFLRDNNEEPLCIEGFCMMDPGNQEWLSFWLQRAIETQEQHGWDGIFMDNVEASLGKRYDEDLIPAKYGDDESYQTAVEGALKYFYDGYFRTRARPLYANIIAVQDWSVWLRYLNYLDGVMIEDFAVDWDSGYKTVEEWESQMEAITKAQGMGKHVILVAQGMKNDMKRQEFSFASYLLINEGKASFRYTEDQVYDEIWLYDDYEINLGAPKAPRYKEGNQWKREFANGVVIVDPKNETSSITLNQ
ncbi:MAG: hypothetical protein HPY59_06645 [Anaerolineae bacterium]|nr:hypothetical protein [Anaerolineae bacterium]